MEVVEIVLLIVALKIPVVGLWALLWWAKQEPEVEYGEPGPEKVRAQPPRLPEPEDPPRGPRRRGPHGGTARPLPSPRRDPHPAPTATPRETAPGPVFRST